MISTCCHDGGHMMTYLCVVASISNSQQEGTDHHHIDAAREVICADTPVVEWYII